MRSRVGKRVRKLRAEAALPFSAVAQRLRISNIPQSAQINLQTHALRLEIDFKPVYLEGYYGTGISNIPQSAQINLQTQVFAAGN